MLAGLMVTATFAQENQNKSSRGKGAEMRENRGGGKGENGKPRQAPTSEERAKQATEQLNGIVGLSADQYQKIYDLNLNFQKQKKEITGGNKMKEENEEVRAKVQTLRKQLREQERAVLTADQNAKLKAHNQEMRAKRGMEHDGKHEQGKDDDRDNEQKSK